MDGARSGKYDMAGPPNITSAAGAGVAPNTAHRSALMLLATLFFMWGFITVINNTLLPHLRAVFDLTYTQTTLIESVWFIAYFFASIPSAKLIERIGYQALHGDRPAEVMAVGALMHDSGRAHAILRPGSRWPRCS